MKTPPYLERGANISGDGVYRYSLWRRLEPGDRTITFIGLNPSTADAFQDDPTIRREVAFARAWGFHLFCKGNLYALRSTDPAPLRRHPDPMGPYNRLTLEALVSRAQIVVAAWGAYRWLSPHARELAQLILLDPCCRVFGLTKNGQPKHPLFLPKSARLLDRDEAGL